MRDFTEIWQLQDTIITAVNACGYGVWDLHATSWGTLCGQDNTMKLLHIFPEYQ